MKTLYAKFVGITLIIMISSSIIAFLSVNTYYHQKLKGDNDQKNMMMLQQLVAYIEKEPPAHLSDLLQAQSGLGYKLIVLDGLGTREDFGEPFRIDNLPIEAVRDVLQGNEYHGMKNLPSETFVTGFFANESSNTVGYPLQYQNQTYALFLRPDVKLLFTEVHYLLGGMVVVMALVSLLAMLIVAKKLIEPITQLTQAIQQVGEEVTVPTISINRQDEIGQLATSFQEMTARLQQNDRLRKEFISDISHDLQSPLANIKGYANLLEPSDLPNKEREQYTQIIQQEADRLSTLTKQLLFLTSIDQLTSPLQMKSFRLDEQIKECVVKSRWAIEEKEMGLTLSLAPVEYRGDPAFLEKVWENILSNAIKYSKKYDSIQVVLEEKEESVEVCITDTGNGIQAQHISRIFDRFYREDDSRTVEVGGTGLGLSIVQQVVELHKGTVQVQSEINRGTVVCVQLPKL